VEHRARGVLEGVEKEGTVAEKRRDARVERGASVVGLEEPAWDTSGEKPRLEELEGDAAWRYLIEEGGELGLILLKQGRRLSRNEFRGPTKGGGVLMTNQNIGVKGELVQVLTFWDRALGTIKKKVEKRSCRGLGEGGKGPRKE